MLSCGAWWTFLYFYFNTLATRDTSLARLVQTLYTRPSYRSIGHRSSVWLKLPAASQGYSTHIFRCWVRPATEYIRNCFVWWLVALASTGADTWCYRMTWHVFNGHFPGQLLPFPFGRICFVVLFMRKRGESSWSGHWHFGCTLEVIHVHSCQDQFIQPSWAQYFCVFSLGLCFVCSFVLCDLFVCPRSFMFPWAVESSPLQFLALA